MFRQLFTSFLLSISINAIAMADGLEDFAFVEGVWQSQTQFLNEDGSWSVSLEAQATGQTALGGAFYQLDAIVPFPGAVFTMRMVFSYDRFNHVHRLIIFDDINGYTDAYVGLARPNGGVIMDNVRTGTGFPNGEGGQSFARLVLQPTDTGFEVLADISVDTDEIWIPYMRIVFEPRG